MMVVIAPVIPTASAYRPNARKKQKKNQLINSILVMKK